MYSKNRIGNRNVHSKLPIIVFQISSISLIESEEFRETSIDFFPQLNWITKKTLSVKVHGHKVILCKGHCY